MLKFNKNNVEEFLEKVQKRFALQYKQQNCCWPQRVSNYVWGTKVVISLKEREEPVTIPLERWEISFTLRIGETVDQFIQRVIKCADAYVNSFFTNKEESDKYLCHELCGWSWVTQLDSEEIGYYVFGDNNVVCLTNYALITSKPKQEDDYV